MYEPTDFVQVKHCRAIESGEPIEFWRNALFVMYQREGFPVVIYTDGEKQVIHSGVKIRKATMNLGGQT